MNKQTFIRNKAIIVVLLALIIGLPTVFFGGYYLARANGGSTKVFETPDASYSYLLWKEDATYYSKKGFGADAGSVTSGTNITQITENMVDALSSGGEIFFTAGTYEFTGGGTPPNKFGMQLDSNIAIRGEGIQRTIFKQADGANINIMITSEGKGLRSNIKISDLSINCNYQNQDYSGVGINDYLGAGISTYGSDWTIENVEVYNAGQYGGIVSHSRDTKILNNDIHDIYSHDDSHRKWITGIMVSYYFANGNLVSGNTVHDFIDGGSGIHVEDESARTRIIGNEIRNIHTTSNLSALVYIPAGIWNEGARSIISLNEIQNCTRGIVDRWVVGKPHESGWQTKITENTINMSYYEGIYVERANYSSILGNTLLNNGYSGVSPNNRQVHIASTSYVKVSDNMMLIDSQHSANIGYDVKADGVSHNITITDNDFYGNVAGGGLIVDVDGNNNTVNHNVGFVTENSGSTNVATGNTVNHGLAGTPTSVLLTITVSEDVWATALGATTFTVNYDGGGTQTVYWYAEYKL